MHGDRRSAGADQRRRGAGQSRQDGFVTIAKVTKTQGRNGEVAATLLTDFPERFASRKRLFAWAGSGETRRELELQEHWFHKGQVVLKFSGVDSISDAETLLGCEIQIPAGERVELQDGSLYVSDLVGCTLLDSGRTIGKIADVQFGSGEAPLLVVQGEKEYLIPFAAGFIDRIELEQKRICMRLPPGMLELDAPLSEEEKQERRQD